MCKVFINSIICDLIFYRKIISSRAYYSRQVKNEKIEYSMLIILYYN